MSKLIASQKTKFIFTFIFLFLFLFLNIGYLTQASANISQDQAEKSGQQLVKSTWGFLKKVLNTCLKFSEECDLSSEEKVIVKNMTKHFQSQLLFQSERNNPGFFDLDDQGLPRSAKTGNFAGAPIYINTDALSTYEPGDYFWPLSISRIVAILTHELGHHQKISDHTYLDELGSKVGNFLENNSENFQEKILGNHLVEIFIFSEPKHIRPDRNYNFKFNHPEVIIVSGQKVHSLSERVASQYLCSHDKYRLGDISIIDSFWMQTSIIDPYNKKQELAKLTANLNLSCYSREGGFELLSSHLNLFFKVEENHISSKIDVLLTNERYQWLDSDVKIPDYYETLEINYLLKSNNIFTAQVKVNSLNKSSPPFLCRGEFSANSFKPSPFHEKSYIPFDSCQFTKISTDIYVFELSYHLPPNTPSHDLYVAKLDVYFPSGWPQRGLFNPIDSFHYEGKSSHQTHQISFTGEINNEKKIDSLTPLELKFKIKSNHGAVVFDIYSRQVSTEHTLSRVFDLNLMLNRHKAEQNLESGVLTFKSDFYPQFPQLQNDLWEFLGVHIITRDLNETYSTPKEFPILLRIK